MGNVGFRELLHRGMDARHIGVAVSENFYIEGWMRVTSALLGKTYTYKYTIDKDNTQGWIWFKIELIQVEDAT